MEFQGRKTFELSDHLKSLLQFPLSETKAYIGKQISHRL